MIPCNVHPNPSGPIPPHLVVAFVLKNNTHAAIIALATTVNTCRNPISTPRSTPHLPAFPPDSTYNLRPNAALHKRLALRIPIHRRDVIVQAAHQTRQRQDPENQPEGQGDALLERRSFVLEVEGDEDGDGDDGQVGC